MANPDAQYVDSNLFTVHVMYHNFKGYPGSPGQKGKTWGLEDVKLKIYFNRVAIHFFIRLKRKLPQQLGV